MKKRSFKRFASVLVSAMVLCMVSGCAKKQKVDQISEETSKEIEAAALYYSSTPSDALIYDNISIDGINVGGKTKEEATFETHRRMLDIQIPLDAPETYGYIPLKYMPEQEYNAEKDVTKYPGVEAQSYVTCYPGMFAIFFPQDGHQPCISDAPQIKKAIFKAEV